MLLPCCSDLHLRTCLRGGNCVDPPTAKSDKSARWGFSHATRVCSCVSLATCVTGARERGNAVCLLVRRFDLLRRKLRACLCCCLLCFWVFFLFSLSQLGRCAPARECDREGEGCKFAVIFARVACFFEGCRYFLEDRDSAPFSRRQSDCLLVATTHLRHSLKFFDATISVLQQMTLHRQMAWT